MHSSSQPVLPPVESDEGLVTGFSGSSAVLSALLVTKMVGLWLMSPWKLACHTNSLLDIMLRLEINGI